MTFDFEWHTPEGTEGTESGRKLLVTSVLVPPHHGGPGLFLSLGGEGEVVFPLAGKKLELKITVKLAGGLAGYLGSGPVQSFAEIAGVGGRRPLISGSRSRCSGRSRRCNPRTLLGCSGARTRPISRCAVSG